MESENADEHRTELEQRLSSIELRHDSASRPTGATPSAMLGALGLLGAVAPALEAAFRAASSAGGAITVAFPREIVKGLGSGSLRLMQTSNGAMATAIDSSGHIVAHARVLSGLAKPQTSEAVAAGAAAVALPIAVAMAASYMQQRQLEKALASISAAVERIEVRLKDADNGVCDAGEQFIELARQALVDGELSPYLRTELAMHRGAVEALYLARRRYVQRFKAELERQQIEREKAKGSSHAWVDHVEDLAKSGELEEELALFVRALICRTKLAVAAAAVIASEGYGHAAMTLLDSTQAELRSEFLDLYRRLRALAVHAPELSRLQRLPGFGRSLEQAHETVQVLVEELDQHVLPGIPDPDDNSLIKVTLSEEEVGIVIQLFGDRVAA